MRLRLRGRPSTDTLRAVFIAAALVAVAGGCRIFFVAPSVSAGNVPSEEHNGMKYITTKFEVTGRVQGVFFRKYTKRKAEELGLTGWCRNTPRDTVEGEFEYVSDDDQQQQSSPSLKEGTGGRWASEAFRHWLCNVGSPHSRIEGCTFSEKVVADSRTFERFRVIH